MSDPQLDTGLKNPDFKTLLNQIPFFNMTRSMNFSLYHLTGLDEVNASYEIVEYQTSFQSSGVELLNPQRGTGLKVEQFSVNVTLPGHNISMMEDYNRTLRPSFPLPFTPVAKYGIERTVQENPGLTIQEIMATAATSSPFYNLFQVESTAAPKGANVEVLAFVPYICATKSKWAREEEYNNFFDPVMRKKPKHERMVRHSVLVGNLLDRLGLETNTFSENEVWKDGNANGINEKTFLLNRRGGFTEICLTLIRSLRKMYKGITDVTPDTPIGISAICVIRGKVTVIPVELLLAHSGSFKSKMLRTVSQIRKTLLSKYAAQSEDIFNIQVNGCETQFKMAYDGFVEPILEELPSKAAQMKEKRRKEAEQINEFYGEEYGFF